MPRLLHLYATIATCVLLDFLWFKVVMVHLVNWPISYQHGPPVWSWALAYYLLQSAGILYFAVYPSAISGRGRVAAYNGARWGLFIHLVYEFPHYATLSSWPFTVLLADVFWGVFAGGVAGLLSFKIGAWLRVYPVSPEAIPPVSRGFWE